MSRFSLRPHAVGACFLTVGRPPDWVQVFGSDGPLELEIGCGAGGFALEYCRRYAHLRYVALEWRKRYAREVQHRAEKHGISNLRVIEGDARFIVARLFAPNSLDAIHIQFPDPWWKRAHHKRSLLQPNFIAVLHGCLKTGGYLDFRTDVEVRAQEGLAALEAAGFVNPAGPGVFHTFDVDELPSTRERRCLRAGGPVYRVRLLRGTSPSSVQKTSLRPSKKHQQYSKGYSL